MYKNFLNLLVSKSRLVFLLLIIGFYTSVNAQEQGTINSFLSSINESKLVYIDSTTTAQLNDKNYSIPIIKSAQFRLETRRFIETFQEYSLRVKPNSFRAMSSQKYIYQNKIEEVRISNQIKINEELKNRYLLIIDYVFNEKLLDFYLTRQQQLKDKLEILGYSVYDENFDIKDLIESEEDLLATNLKLIQLQKTEKDQLFYLKEILEFKERSLEINFENLIQPEQVIGFHIPDSVPHELLFISLEKLKLKTINNEMKLSVAESKQFLDFVQAKYIGKSENLFEENLSLGLGINLPFFGTARQEKSEYYFEKLTKEYELKDEIKRHNLKITIAKNEYDNAILNFETLNNQNKESSVSLVYETYKKMEGVSPLLLLKLKVMQNKKDIEILKFEQTLYISFIEYLSLNEILFQKPYLNYLSGTLELLVD
jgi:hypothetical protein